MQSFSFLSFANEFDDEKITFDSPHSGNDLFGEVGTVDIGNGIPSDDESFLSDSLNLSNAGHKS